MRIQIMTICGLMVSSIATLTNAQVTVGIEDYAIIPGNPARMSVMTTDSTGRLFVNDQNGALYTVDRNTRAVTSYLDLSDDTAYPTLDLISSGEPGFQSFAFHPDFGNTGAAGFGKFYTMHSSTNTSTPPDFDPGGNTVFHSLLLEWTTANATSSTFQPADINQPFREVARFKQPFGNHNAGLISFNTSVGMTDSDRNNLYVAIGDGGNGDDPQDNGQDTGNPYGALLRINPLGTDSANEQYGIVADNIFAGDNDDGTLAEIYSYGLRNPQRFGWDDRTGNLFIADIGQDAFEEINLAANSGNFGWDIREGNTGGNLPGAIDPVAAYSHSGFVQGATTGSRAITVGEVAIGTNIAGLDGNLLLGDFPNGIIYYFDPLIDPLDGGSDGLTELLLLDESGQQVRLIDLIRETRNNNSLSRADLRFSLGTDGEVFILNKHDGVIRRLISVPEPTAILVLAGALVLLGTRRRRLQIR